MPSHVSSLGTGGPMHGSARRPRLQRRARAPRSGRPPSWQTHRPTDALRTSVPLGAADRGAARLGTRSCSDSGAPFTPSIREQSSPSSAGKPEAAISATKPPSPISRRSTPAGNDPGIRSRYLRISCERPPVGAPTAVYSCALRGPARQVRHSILRSASSQRSGRRATNPTHTDDEANDLAGAPRARA